MQSANQQRRRQGRLNLVPLDEGGIDPQSFSAHTLLASTTAPQSYLQAHEVGATQEELAKMEKYKAWEAIVQHASNGSTLGLLRDRQAVSMQSSIGA